MEPILTYLRRKLREAGPAHWEAIADATGLPRSLPRKLAYDNARLNPGVQKVQPLLDLFQAIERGERELPTVAANDETKTRD